MIYKYEITTGCCEAANTHKVVTLQFPFSIETMDTPYTELKPIWSSRGFQAFRGDSSMMESAVEIKFCPFCAKSVPEIELNYNVKSNIHDSDGDYCLMCDKRNMECRCLPPVFRWKPVGVEVELPIIEEDEE